jgi:hypothetical protein
LKVNSREPVCRIVADQFVDGPFEYGRYRAACAMMHTVAQLEIAEIELGVIDMKPERVEFGLVELVVLPDLWWA